MSKQDTGAQSSRRRFLKNIAAAGGAAGAVAVIGGAVADTEVEVQGAAKPQAKSRGYHLTPHIQTYYDKARF